ncbi:hypothetical protein DFH08DRAFT_803910 [Mycena albidolilacea]|uniref:Uncharacterized protein n=1 Tax=Mycena albidolilacea TaxID=1033008 RepID=A0AAD7AE28_9AGAR|nr:hypothetical protein DFH08DRAFT_803910 [Mycena albidolilacea]
MDRKRGSPPVLLVNKDNAAMIALGNERDSAAIKCTLKVSQRGGHKVVSLCGDIFQHKDDKRGHQDLRRYYMSKGLTWVLGLPTGLGHGWMAATGCETWPNLRVAVNPYGFWTQPVPGTAELLTYLTAHIRFFTFICNTKQAAGLNHMEEDALMGLQDEITICELVAMTAYKIDPPEVVIHSMGAVDLPVEGVTLTGSNNTCAEMLMSGSTLKVKTDCAANHASSISSSSDSGSSLLLTVGSYSQLSKVTAQLFTKPYYKNAVPDPYFKIVGRAGAHCWSLRTQHSMGNHFQINLPWIWNPTWRCFSKEFHAGSTIDTLTPAEKLLISIPATNDPNESILGGWRVYSRIRGSTMKHEATYHCNNTEAFADAKLTTEEDVLYVMQLARAEDSRVAEETCVKEAEKNAEATTALLKLQSIVVITDAEKLKALPVKKGPKGGANLREQLDVRRELWKDEVLVKTKLKDVSKKVDMLAAILAADARQAATAVPGNAN